MTSTISERARADATVALRAAGCVFAEDEADVLISAVTDESALADLVRRRATGEPLEQVVGFADFCGVRITLRPGVFVPRVRSELLVRRAAEAAVGLEHPVVLDLCCGSGALAAAVAVRVPGVELHAADLEPAAVACARDNLAALGGQVYEGDLFAALPAGLRGRIDVLLANVPYVQTGHLAFLPAEARLHEPRRALDGGADGLDVFRAVVAGAAPWLAPGGVLLSEVTDAQTGAAVQTLLAAGLSPDVGHDDDLETSVVIGTRTATVPGHSVLR